MTAACKEDTQVSKVKVEEFGRKAIILNPERRTFSKVEVDGCLIKNGTAADWIVSQENLGSVIIELKGTDVDHAVKQICATAQHCSAKTYLVGKMAALIVAKQYPKANTRVQKAQQGFAAKYKGPLHVVTKNYEFEFENLLSFRGPHTK